MYIKRIKIKNQGPLTNVDFSFPFIDDKPYPIVLTGVNGSGKTITLSDILNSYVNLKSSAYDEIPETQSGKLYKVQTASYTNENYSYYAVEFNNGFHSELAYKNEELFFLNENINEFDFLKIKKEDGPFFSKTSSLKEKDFKDVFLYYPVDRYYKPAWINQSNDKLSFNDNYDKFYKKSYNNSIVYDLLQDINQWILDVIIDKYLYDSKAIQTQLANGHIFEKEVYDGTNTNIQKAINNILTKILKSKDPNISSARFGISSKVRRQISIIVTKNNIEYEYAESFSHLSSGEVMVFSMFSNIIKNASNFSSFDEIKGIVIIDEIDENLHIAMCKNVLPQLINLFPKIQFVISSHSPFFLLGMEEQFKDKFMTVSLPEFVEDNVVNFEEIKRMYDIVNVNFNTIIEENKKLITKISENNKIIILGEGKTDIYHLKNSLNRIKGEEEFSSIDVDFYDAEECTGNSKVYDLVKSISKFKFNKNIIIAIFDSDDKTIKEPEGKITNIGNNVYVYVLPNIHEIPGGASIEFMYDLNDITIRDASGRKLYLSSEFNAQYRLLSDLDVSCGIPNKIDCYYKNGVNKIIDDKVFNSKSQNIALSKNDFAEHILNNDPEYMNVSYNGFRIVWREIKKICGL